MGFISNPEAYDVVKLGGQQLPGELDIDVIERELAKRHKRGSGDDGAEAHFKGLKHYDFHLNLKLHTDEDEAEWARLLPIFINFSNPQSRNELSVEHPQIRRMGISKCVVFKVGERKPKNGDPITAFLWCSTVQVKTGASHTPKGSKYKLPIQFSSFGVVGVGEGPSIADQNPTDILKDRRVSAVQQARIDNGIAARVALSFPGFSTTGVGSK